MKEFTSTQLRVKSSDVYNEVHKAGVVAIKHRDRPPMVLISRDWLNEKLVRDGFGDGEIAEVVRN